MKTIGIDLGSSSIKISIFAAETGCCIDTVQEPSEEMDIESIKPDWAEQDPELWWTYLKLGLKKLITNSKVDINEIKAIGISYQMHGLICVDKNLKPLRKAIIWSDSRAVTIGNKAFDDIGMEICSNHLLNSPGNFTASKLAWVKENEPEIYQKIYKIMLPGDFIAMKFTGKINTTPSGLSEGIFWDFVHNNISSDIIKNFNFDSGIFPDIVEQFGYQGEISDKTARETGLTKGTFITYRAGDQPNAALSLNVFEPGEVAASAGTSGVIYAVADKSNFDKLSRYNNFIHVNHKPESPRYGVLLCINGTGILNSWIKKTFAKDLDYRQINEIAVNAPIGSEGLSILPFGNGAERMLENITNSCQINGINFNVHRIEHFLRASQEGIAFAFNYGINILNQKGINIRTIKAPYSSMFLSPLFRQTLANITNCKIELYNTDGSLGAARAAAYGAGKYNNLNEAFANLKIIKEILPEAKNNQLLKAYDLWLITLNKYIHN
jgi:xylulokinase